MTRQGLISGGGNAARQGAMQQGAVLNVKSKKSEEEEK